MACFELFAEQGYDATTVAEMDELERRMFVANPELAALRTARTDAAIRESTRVVAEDLGVAPDAVGPRMAATAATAVIIELFTGVEKLDLEQAMAAALRFIEAGIESLAQDAG